MLNCIFSNWENPYESSLIFIGLVRTSRSASLLADQIALLIFISGYINTHHTVPFWSKQDNAKYKKEDEIVKKLKAGNLEKET